MIINSFDELSCLNDGDLVMCSYKGKTGKGEVCIEDGYFYILQDIADGSNINGDMRGYDFSYWFDEDEIGEWEIETIGEPDKKKLEIRKFIF